MENTPVSTPVNVDNDVEPRKDGAEDLPDFVEPLSIIEKIPKDAVIIAVCSNGNGRSKFISRVLRDIGYPNCMAMSFRNLYGIDESRREEISVSPLIVCANSDVAATFSNHNDGELVEGKLVIDLKMSENDHAIASGHFPGEKHAALVEKLTKQLQDLGFGESDD